MNMKEQYFLVSNLISEKKELDKREQQLQLEVDSFYTIKDKISSNNEEITEFITSIEKKIEESKKVINQRETLLIEIEESKTRLEEQETIFELINEYLEYEGTPKGEVDSPFVNSSDAASSININSTNVLPSKPQPKFNNCSGYFCYYSGLTVEEFPSVENPLTDEQFDECFSRWISSRPFHVAAEASITELSDVEVMDIFYLRKHLIDTAYCTYEEVFIQVSNYQYDVLSKESNSLDALRDSADIEEIRQYLMSSDLSKDSSSASKDNTDSIEAVVDNFNSLEEFPTILNYCTIKVEGENIKEDSSIAELAVNSTNVLTGNTVISTNKEFFKVMGKSRPATKAGFTKLLKENQQLIKYVSSLSEEEAKQFCILNKDIISNNTREEVVIPLASWINGTLADAIAAPDSIFDVDCLKYVSYFVNDIDINAVYTWGIHKTLINGIPTLDKFNIDSNYSIDCLQFVEHGLLQYFYPQSASCPFHEGAFNIVSDWIVKELYKQD